MAGGKGGVSPWISGCFRPWPVITQTVRSLGSITPSCLSLAAAAKEIAPAGSA